MNFNIRCNFCIVRFDAVSMVEPQCMPSGMTGTRYIEGKRVSNVEETLCGKIQPTLHLSKYTYIGLAKIMIAGDDDMFCGNPVCKIQRFDFFTLMYGVAIRDNTHFYILFP